MIVWGLKSTELNKKHVDWLSDRIGQGRGWDYHRSPTLGSYVAGKLVGVVLYHDLNPEAGVVCMSAAGDDARWMGREVITAAHNFPFDQLGCQAVVLQVSEKNSRMLGIAERLGYTLHRIPRLRGRNEAEVLCLLADNTWKSSPYARKSHGKAASPRSS